MTLHDIDRLRGAPVLVTGASGFSGSVLVRQLVQAGAKVRGLARPSSRVEHLQEFPVEWIRGEVFDPATVEHAAQGVEYIFHLAAAYREAGISDETYRNVHVLSTKLLAAAATKNSNFKRFIHTSTVGVHGHIDNPPADESYAFAPGDIYQSTKLEAEQWICNFAQERQLPLTVIRPAAILGPGDRRLLKIFKMACRSFYPVIGNGRCLYHLIHVEDLASAMIQAAVSEAAIGQIFIIGNTEPYSLKQMIETISRKLGYRPTEIRLPAWPFFAAAALCEAACRPFGIEPPIYKRRVAFFTKDRAFNTNRMQQLLKFTPRFTNQSGLEQTADWYVQKGWLKAGTAEPPAGQLARTMER
ncbi:MAG: NAD-dependent epimerase/dehydratase family protein [Oligoflexia bacterium]|nr:NAD-dependent epimerase/dehydratase family protein [Oligoflexia bacterium]